MRVNTKKLVATIALAVAIGFLSQVIAVEVFGVLEDVGFIIATIVNFAVFFAGVLFWALERD